MITGNENLKRLIDAIGENQLSVKEMLIAVGLKDRPYFLEYSLSPAMNEDYVRMLYPDVALSSATEISPDSKRLSRL